MTDVSRRELLTSAPQTVLRGVRTLMASLRAEHPPRAAASVALLDVTRCLAWADALCQACYVRCPLRDRALILHDFKPLVVPSVCDGCGACVAACRAVNDHAAIALVTNFSPV